MAKSRAFTCRGATRRSRPATATTRATSTGPQTSRAYRRTRMARTTTCSWSRCCAATRSRPKRSGKARNSATGAGSSARTMTVWREALTGPCRRGRALTTASSMWFITRASACQSSSSRTERHRCQEEGAARGAHASDMYMLGEALCLNAWASAMLRPPFLAI